MDETKYYLQIDLLKGFAIISVLIMHSFDIVTGTTGLSTLIVSSSLNSASFIQMNPISLFGLIQTIKVLSLWQAIPLFFVMMGITLGMSFKRHNYFSLKETYSKTYFRSRFIRLYFPYVILFVISVILALVTVILFNLEIFTNLSVLNFVGYLPIVGPNFGLYFITLVFEVIFIFPIIYLAYKKNPKLTLIIVVIIDIIYQIIAFYYINDFINSICIIRFISALTIGLWISDQSFNFNNSVDKLITIKNFIIDYKVLVSLAIIGFFYLLLWYFFYMGYLTSYLYPIPYLNHNFSIFSCQNVISFFYISVLIILGFLIFPNKSRNILIIKLSDVGKVSYHIFLIQIIYFNFFYIFFPVNNLSTIDKLTIIVGNVLISIILGFLFYYVEQKISSKVFSKKNIKIK